MKKIFLTLFSLVLLPAAWALDRFEVLGLTGPQEASSGEKITVNMTVKVLEVDTPVYLRPAAQYNFPADNKARNLPADQMIPWKIDKFKVGDILKLAATFTLPEGLTPGSTGSLRFMIYRSNNRTWARFEKNLPVYSFKIRKPKTMDLSVPAAPVTPVAVVPAVSSAPIIDGKGNDAVWQKALTLTLSSNSLNGKQVASPAKVKLLTDYKKLYCLMISSEKVAPQAIERFKHRDSSLWKNDGFECMIAPDKANNDYLHFMSDLADQQYDAFNADTAGFNPPWQSKAVRNADGWVIETAIPLSAITAKQVTPGTVWRANFFRTGKKYNTAWNATMGSHSALKRFGLLVFGSMQQALNERVAELKQNVDASSAEMKQLLQAADKLAARENAADPAKFVNALAQADELAKKIRDLQFAQRFAASGSPLVVQYADPYASGVPQAGNAPFAGELAADFFAGEVRDFAVNLTNTSKQVLTVRCGLFATQSGKFKYNTGSVDYLYMNIPDFKTEFFSVTPVSAFDGTAAGDALAPNPAGTFTIAPGATCQLFISVTAPDHAAEGKGQLVIDSVAGHKFESIILPVNFSVSNGKLLPEVKPITFGWDYMHEPMMKDRQEYTRKHYQMLKDYGFNTTMVSNLRHLPRPKASADGKIPAVLDFSRLRKQLDIIGKFDYYYLDIAIWNQKLQNKELFYLDFYDPAYATAFRSWFKQVLAELASHGINSGNLLVCPIDEAADKRAETIARWIKEVDPAVKVIIDCSTDNMQQLKSLDRYVDVWMPHMRTLPQEALAEFHNYVKQQNKIRLAYYYSAGGEEKIKAPYADYILNFYRLYARGFSGLGFWAAGQYYGDPWYRKAYPGVYDTSLIYPALNGPIPSRRLAAWRRGTQDLWLLRTAEKMLGSDSASVAKLQEAARLTAEYPNDSKRSVELRQYCRQILAK